jgi:methionyl-tRNA formyltransferase
MRITEELDAGNVLMTEKVEIFKDEDAPALSSRLAKIGARLLLETINRIEKGISKETPQDSGRTTFAPLLSKEDGKIDWKKSVHEISNRVRGFRPWPGAFTFFDGKIFKVHKARPHDDDSEKSCGTLFRWDGRPAVACGKGTLELCEVQLEGKKAMSADEFARGFRLEREVILK